jgi:O-antigen/teichoic acid export membrane protein
VNNSTLDRKRTLVSGVALVAAATFLASAANYGLNIFAAHTLSPSDFGGLGALLGVLAVFGTLSLTLQAVVARAVGKNSSDFTNREVPVLSALWLAIAAVLFCLLLVVPVSRLIDVSLVSTLLALLTVPISVGASAVIGLLQGKETFLRLSLSILAVGIFRASCGVIGLWISQDLLGFAVGLILGSVISLGFCLALVPERLSLGLRPTRRQIVAFLVVLQAIGLMFVLANIDVVLARFYLSPTESGVYAVGSLLAKIAFFLPAPILIVLYPSMVKGVDRRPLFLAILATGAIGLVTVFVTILAPARVAGLLAGPELSSVAPTLWLFAVSGSLMALVQVTLYARLAKHDVRAAILSFWCSWLSFAYTIRCKRSWLRLSWLDSLSRSLDSGWIARHRIQTYLRLRWPNSRLGHPVIQG